MMQTVLNILLTSVTEIVYLFGILIAAGLLLGWIELASNAWAYQALGKFGILLTALVGTPIHEAGHAVMCLIFGHKIEAVKLFEINPVSLTLGYVKHSYNKRNIYQRIGMFFISLGPIFSGTAAILLFLYFLEPGIFKTLQSLVVSAPVGSMNILDLLSWSGRSIILVYKGIFNIGNAGSPTFWVFLFLTMCTASHIALSRTDIINAVLGFAVALMVIVLFNTAAAICGFDTLKYVLLAARYNIYLVSVLAVSVAFSLITAVVMGFLYRIRILFI